MLKKSFAAIAAIALLAGSSAAAAQTAQPLSLNNAPAARTGASADGSSQLGSRGYGIYVIGAIVVALLVWGAIELLDDDEGPGSP